MNNQKMRLLSLVLAAAIALGSVTAFADGEPAAPETTETTEITSEETAGSWNGDTYTDNQGITYQLNGDFITVTGTSTNFSGGAITIPDAIEKDGISYLVTGVGGHAFYYCDALKTLTFSSSVDSIGNNAFQYCIALDTVTFSGDVRSIGFGAFESCGALDTVTFSGDVGSIGDSAFWGCNALKTLTFSGDVGSIGREAFYNCRNLNTVTFSGNVGSIGDSAFWDCTALKTLTFSGDVGSIEDLAFQYCTALTTIYVPVRTTEDTIDMIRKALNSSRLQNVQIERREPEQPSDPAPDTGTPSAPDTGTTSTTGSASTAVQQLEAAERPDPQDVEANKRYNFWMGVKSDLRAAGDGRTVRVYVPADYTNMPASVMEQIRLLDKDITVDLRWSGERLTITPATAQRKTALKAFWTFEQLCELYAQ